MFPGKIPDNFTMSSSKVSYLVSEATGPYFKQVVADDVKKTQGHLLPYSMMKQQMPKSTN